jgi:hypothetical protein
MHLDMILGSGGDFFLGMLWVVFGFVHFDMILGFGGELFWECYGCFLPHGFIPIVF